MYQQINFQLVTLKKQKIQTCVLSDKITFSSMFFTFYRRKHAFNRFYFCLFVS